MTNKEFYFDKLLAVTLTNTCGQLHRAVHGEECTGEECKDCEFYTVETIEKWLNAEYEEPLLKNGDGLKPGDLIMVRDEVGHAWKKRCFMCCKNGYFITTEGECSVGTTGRYDAWLQARLPMEGELQ
jgi:hypothetical protein